jgi:hypothetical protein
VVLPDGYDVTGLLRVQFDGFSVVQTDGEGIVFRNPINGGEVTRADAVLTVGGRELYAVPYSQVAPLLAIDGTLFCLLFEESRIVGGLMAGRCFDGEGVARPGSASFGCRLRDGPARVGRHE